MYIKYLFLFLGISEAYVTNLNITYQDCGSKGYIVYTMTSTDDGFKSLSFNYAVSGANVDSTTSILSLYGDDSFTCVTPDLSNVNKVGSFFLLVSTLSATDTGEGFLPLFTVEQSSPHTFYQLVDGKPNSLEITNLQINYQDDSGTVVQYSTVNYVPLPEYIPTPCDSCENSACTVGIDTGSRTCQAPSPPICTGCSYVSYLEGYDYYNEVDDGWDLNFEDCVYNSANNRCEIDASTQQNYPGSVNEHCVSSYTPFEGKGTGEPIVSECYEPGEIKVCTYSSFGCSGCSYVSYLNGNDYYNSVDDGWDLNFDNCVYNSESNRCEIDASTQQSYPGSTNEHCVSSYTAFYGKGTGEPTLSECTYPVNIECYNSDLDISPPQSPLPVQNSPSPPILPPLSPPKTPPSLPPPSLPPSPSPSPPPLNPSPESPPLYPSPFSPPPLTPPS